MSDTTASALGDRVERFKLLNAKMAEQVTRTTSYRCLRPYPHAGKNRVRRIVRMGMGCSAVVGELLRLFLFAEHNHIEARVINDYCLDWYVNDEAVADPHTVFVLCSYSGSSQEPLIAYDYLAARTNNIVVWSSGKGGDELEARALADGHAAFQWQLNEEDPEYPCSARSNSLPAQPQSAGSWALCPVRARLFLNGQALSLPGTKPRRQQRLWPNALSAGICWSCPTRSGMNRSSS